MRKIHLVVGMLLILSSPVFADTDMKWKVQVTDKHTQKPIEGVKISFDLFDSHSENTSHNVCTSNAVGECEVAARVTSGFFVGGGMEAREIKFSKENYIADSEIKWSNQGRDKLFKIQMISEDWLDVQRKKMEEVRQEKLKLEDMEKSVHLELTRKISSAEEKSKLTCLTKNECDKMFSLTEIYIAKISDMKIQLATATTIETFNPAEDLKLGLTAFRIPSKGSSSIIAIKVICKEVELKQPESSLNVLKLNTLCLQRRLSATEGFPPFIYALLKN